jgi:hypothetical protein
MISRCTVSSAGIPRKPPCHLFRTGGTAGWRACGSLSGMGPYRKSRLTFAFRRVKDGTLVLVGLGEF